jgi:hypothetical protein
MFILYKGSYCEFYKETDTFLTRLSETKWMRYSSKMLDMANKIVNCLVFHKRNVFLEERRNNTDCSCIINSLVKICLNAKYRTIAGLENLIQKDWFLAGHMFLKRLYATSSSKANVNVGESEYVADEHKRRLSVDSNNFLGSAENIFSSGTSKSKEEFAPTFLLFLDCLFQLTMQCPNEFEYNEFYLIHLWDYSISGLSFTYGFNGIADWLQYLNNQTFLAASNLPIDSFSSVNLINPGTCSINNKYLQEIFELNISFWLNHLTKNASLLVNKNFKVTTTTIIIKPCDKMYMLKFWSRCYLRWIEKYHSYNNFIDGGEIEIATTITNNQALKKQEQSQQQEVTKNTQSTQPMEDAFKPRKPPPPPNPIGAIPPSLPPKPLKTPVDQQPAILTISVQQAVKSEEKVDKADATSVGASTGIVVETPSDKKCKIVTRITSDGNIESSF